jgi:hypothetical protein
MNHCSWKCGYCHEQLRNSSIDLVSVKDCVRFIHAISDHIHASGRSIEFNFTGGEVTEWNEFATVIQTAHDRNNSVRFRSNANCAIDVWKQLMIYTDSVTLDIHPEYTLISKFILALDYAVRQDVSVTVNANMMKDRWEEIEQVCKLISEKYPAVNVNKKMVFEDPLFNTQPQDYDNQQISEIKLQLGDLILTDNEGNQQYTDYQTMILEKKNHFAQWTCDIGLEQIVVDAWGRIFRGHCRVGGKIGEITDQSIRWPNQSVTCLNDVCRNAFDIQATKSL